MTLNKITKSTVMSYADENIYTTINNRTNVADPRDRSSNVIFVYRNDPYLKNSNFTGYPYIILRFPDVEYNNITVDGNVKDISWRQTITIRTEMGGAINFVGQAGITDMQSILDDLIETFNSKSIKDQLRLLSMYNLKISITGNDEFIDDNNRHIFETELELTYKTRMNLNS